MYVCLTCYDAFSEPKKCYGGELEYWGAPYREEYWGSPCCEEAYAETWACSVCGSWLTGEYIKTAHGDRICSGCYCSYDIGDED